MPKLNNRYIILALGVLAMVALVAGSYSVQNPMTCVARNSGDRAVIVQSANGSLRFIVRSVDPPPTDGVTFDLSQVQQIDHIRPHGHGAIFLTADSFRWQLWRPSMIQTRIMGTQSHCSRTCSTCRMS